MTKAARYSYDARTGQYSSAPAVRVRLLGIGNIVVVVVAPPLNYARNDHDTSGISSIDILPGLNAGDSCC